MSIASKRAGNGEGYALLVINPLRAIRSALDNGPTDFQTLIRGYRHLLPSDYARIKLHERLTTDEEATDWLFRHGLKLLAEWIDFDGATVTLKPGFSPNDLRWDGKPIPPETPNEVSHLKSPFSTILESGTFAENIRAKGKDDLAELRESMQTFGWIEHHPAILDEHGVILVGHRRMKVAEELGIRPKTVTVNLGSGDAADAERLKLALASNMGGKPLSAADRRHIAERLYGSGEWTMEKIAKLLDVAQSTITEDLRDLSPPINSQRRRGRPKEVKSVITPPVQAALFDVRKYANATGEMPTRQDLERAGHSPIVAQTARAVHELTGDFGLDALRRAWRTATESERATFLDEIKS